MRNRETVYVECLWCGQTMKEEDATVDDIGDASCDEDCLVDNNRYEKECCE